MPGNVAETGKEKNAACRPNRRGLTQHGGSQAHSAGVNKEKVLGVVWKFSVLVSTPVSSFQFKFQIQNQDFKVNS
jgi:hypothetical protein